MAASLASVRSLFRHGSSNNPPLIQCMGRFLKGASAAPRMMPDPPPAASERRSAAAAATTYDVSRNGQLGRQHFECSKTVQATHLKVPAGSSLHCTTHRCCDTSTRPTVTRNSPFICLSENRLVCSLAQGQKQAAPALVLPWTPDPFIQDRLRRPSFRSFN